MSDSDSTPAAAKQRKQFWSKVITVVILLIVAALKPKVDEWLNGPNGANRATTNADLRSESGGSKSSGIEVADFDLDSFIANQDAPPQEKTSGSSRTSGTTKSGNSGSDNRSSSKPGTSSKASGTDSRSNPNKNSNPKSGSTATPAGKLTVVNRGRQEFRSTAGLMYVRGSREGHRIKHVLEHAKDNLDKPVHGVFDVAGDRDKGLARIVAWIDLAYEKGKKGGKGTRQERQGDRMIYTVRMDKQIGYVGGQKGKRNNKRPCQYLRLVLQNGNEVVTAYPQDSL